MIKKFFWSLIFGLLISCSPKLELLVKNRTGEPVSMVWTSKLDSLTLHLEDDPTPKRDFISLGIRPADRDAILFFGSGMWTDELIKNYVRERVESVELIGGSSTIFYSDPEEIIQLLQGGRRKIISSRIVIVLR